jgi:hypothetical protein
MMIMLDGIRVRVHSDSGYRERQVRLSQCRDLSWVCTKTGLKGVWDAS